MIKKCVNCKTQNPPQAVYCRKCGLPFEQKAASNDEIKAIKRLTHKWKKYAQWKKPITGFLIRCIIWAVLSVIFVSITGYVLERMGKDLYIQNIGAALIGLTLFIIGIIINRKQLPTKKEKESFNLRYDKIEPYCYLGICHSRKRKLYKIFLKGDRMGLLDVSNYKLAIEPHYSSMKWKKKQSILTVTLNNDTFDINTNGEYL